LTIGFLLPKLLLFAPEGIPELSDPAGLLQWRVLGIFTMSPFENLSNAQINKLS
jgi:hypothetical protein